MAISFDEKLNKEIIRSVKNFNSKVYRLRKKGVENLPDTASVRSIKEMYSGQSAKRRELLYELKDLQRFSKRGSETTVHTSEGYNISSYELEKANRHRIRGLRKANREIKEQKSILNRLKREEKWNAKTKQSIINTEKYLNKLESISKSLKNKFVGSPQRIKTISSTFSKFFSSKRRETFYDSFFKALYSEAGLVKLSPDKKKYLEETLGKLNPDELLEAERNNPLIKSIFEYYGVADESDEESLISLFNQLISSAEDVVEEYSM